MDTPGYTSGSELLDELTSEDSESTSSVESVCSAKRICYTWEKKRSFQSEAEIEEFFKEEPFWNKKNDE